MFRYVINRFFHMVISLFVLISATFFLMKAIPGDPFTAEKKIPEQILQRLYAQYNLDKPVFEQYGIYLKNILQGDLGISMKMLNQDVSHIIGQTFSASLKLGVVAIIVAILVGITLGMLAALHHRKLIDNVAMVLAVLGIAVPSFVVASLLQYLLAYHWKIFPVMGFNGPMNYFLPVMALTASPIAVIARLTRSSMLEVLHADYIKTAKAKGLSWGSIVFRHVLRNGIMPVVTYVGPMTANIITGSVVIEQIFGIGGIGKQFVQAINTRDYPIIMGITIFYGVILMVARFLTDVAYVAIDPRIKLTQRKED
ncbi:oligopeptide transport system permease protein OppB [Paenibacillus albidus]|uniref:Oligopeptide transport system permease protein OppB n=1 Tax=Paenibacillus albidus TaxID=2041023 RepID=A0A917CAG7_9BACL|nr:ABC transporter permease [Paenibacillus albidus]GGF77925.1 oligopeptide transport system permease protein OppB [Paenibacillus albidus]